MAYLKVLEGAFGKKAKLEMLSLQAGDIPDTFPVVLIFKTSLAKFPK